ncbi:N-acyl homoserine lactonase family protein [Hydrogenophaga palleronii]|uniref:N-acyl homoserine lactonase family protein n=1 Tax=Hydrogenophaga palleronii TaxID=65655 RepID=UPI000AD26810|nr:N-acyl homoserine lactonase family protein [Hydrogenophaga palleronii]
MAVLCLSAYTRKQKMTSVRRLYVLLCGFEILPKTISTRGLGSHLILSEPVCAYLLDTDQGWTLLDAGMNPDYLATPENREKYFGQHGMTCPVIRKPHLMETQLEQIGITFEDISHVIISHLHFDHCGYLGRLKHAKISIQQCEHAFAFSDEAGVAYFRSDYDMPELDWDLRSGDWEAVPGLSLISTRGHTQGHQSAIVQLPNHGTVILPFDVGDLAENFEHEILPGESCDDEASLAAIRRIKSIRDSTDGEIFLFHDPVAIQAMRLAPAFYD